MADRESVIEAVGVGACGFSVVGVDFVGVGCGLTVE